jgi:hypothetical protein
MKTRLGPDSGFVAPDGRQWRRVCSLSAAVSLALCSVANAGVASTAHSWRSLAASSPALNVASTSPLTALIYESMDLGKWEDHLRQALVPEFGKNLGFGLELDFSLLAEYEHLFLPGFVETGLVPESGNLFTLDLYAGRVPETPFITDMSSRLLAFNRGPGIGVERSLFAPGMKRQIGQSSSFDVAAVFAHQQYSTYGMGSEINSQSPMALTGTGFPSESTAGTGLRLGFASELASGVSLHSAYQSRIDMDAFQSYRGVFSEPGDFDIPASANIGVVVQASPRASLSFDVQRVLYSEINTFTTALLPDRFLSLLGDSGSPEFNWRDLTVYSVGYNYETSEDFQWQISYSTSFQPTPTSAALSQAMAPEFADRNMSFGFSTQTGENARLNFAANYAPSEYLIGSNVGRQTDFDNRQFEFEMIWIWNF